VDSLSGGGDVLVGTGVGEAVALASSVSLASAVWAAAVSTVFGSGVGEASGLPLLHPVRTIATTIKNIPNGFNFITLILTLSRNVFSSPLSLEGFVDLINFP
jgi:hypothetical protein